MKRRPVPLHGITIQRVRCRVTNVGESKKSEHDRTGTLHVSTNGLTFHWRGLFRLHTDTIDRDTISGVITSGHSVFRTHGFFFFFVDGRRYEFRTPKPADAATARMLLCSGLYSSRRR